MGKSLAKSWSIDDPIGYFLIVLILALFIRAIHSALSGIKIAYEKDSPWLQSAKWIFIGYAPKRLKISANYWFPFIIGLFELAMYPILFKLGAATAIGAWIGLKTLAQWKVWVDDRATFNLFLIGNLFVIVPASFLVDFIQIAK